MNVYSDLDFENSTKCVNHTFFPPDFNGLQSVSKFYVDNLTIKDTVKRNYTAPVGVISTTVAAGITDIPGYTLTLPTASSVYTGNSITTIPYWYFIIVNLTLSNTIANTQALIDLVFDGALIDRRAIRINSTGLNNFTFRFFKQLDCTASSKILKLQWSVNSGVLSINGQGFGQITALGFHDYNFTL